MSEFSRLRERIPAILKALAIAIPAGYLFDLLGTPIPWMVGPMIAVATLNLMGVRMHSPPFARQMGQVILGSAVGLYFTPPVVTELAANFVAIVVATASAFLVAHTLHTTHHTHTYRCHTNPLHTHHTTYYTPHTHTPHIPHITSHIHTT